MLTSTVVVDSREGAVKESGDIILSKVRHKTICLFESTVSMHLSSSNFVNY